MKYLLIITLIFFASCSTPEKIEHRRQKKCELASYKWGCNWGRDTSYIKETITNTIIKDTTIQIYLPGDTVHDSISIEVFIEPSFKGSYLSTPLAESRAYILNGKLRHTLIQRDSVFKAHIEKAIRISQYFTKEATVKVIEKRIHYNTAFDRFLINSSKVFWTILVLSVGTIIFLLMRKP